MKNLKFGDECWQIIKKINRENELSIVVRKRIINTQVNDANLTEPKFWLKNVDGLVCGSEYANKLYSTKEKAFKQAMKDLNVSI